MEKVRLGCYGPHPMRALMRVIWWREWTNYASMHSMGLMYDKGSEGADYPNNTMPGQQSPFVETMAVSPGKCVVYKWMVNEGAGK